MKKFLFIIPALTPLYLIRISLFGLPTNLFEILAVAALLLTFTQWREIELRKFWQDNKFFCLGILLILLGVIASLLYNKTYGVSLGILKSWFLLPIIFSFILCFVLKDRKEVLFVLKGIYFSIVAVAIISFGYKLSGLVTFDDRLQAFYNSPNYLAMFLAPGIFLGWYFIKSKTKEKSFYIISFALILFSLYFTYSYAAWIAIALSFFIISSFGNKFNLKIFFSSVFILLILLISQLNNPKLANIFNDNPRSSLASRAMVWQASGKMIADSPVFGIGAGNFQNTYLDYQKYFPLYLEWAVPQPHNLFLAFWLETGLVGLVGFILIIFCVFRALIKLIKKRQDRDLAFALLAIFLYILLHGLADTTYWKNDLAFLFWIFAFSAVFIASGSKTDPV